jgi:2-isopropylmalate synthase
MDNAAQFAASPQRVRIFDTTLRDGEQSPGCSMTASEKLRMARQLERLGVDILEAGFPMASEGDYDSVAGIAAEIRDSVVAGLARARTGDIERCWSAIERARMPRIHTFLATSDIHLEHKLRISRQQCLEQVGEAVRLARSLCGDVEFSAEDASRTELAFLAEVARVAVEAGAATVNLPDTVGYAIPAEIEAMIAAVHAGARQVECTVNGIGERAGNAALEEIVMAFVVRGGHFGHKTAIRTIEIFPSSQLLTELTGVSVQPHKAIVGSNAFAHEAGIHQDGVLKNPLTYEIMTPQSVGVNDNRIVLGKHSGRSALGRRCEQLGYNFERRELDGVYRLFVALADRVKTVDDKALLDVIRQALAAGVVTAA